MALNRLSVLLSIKTLRPEVEDYWLPIPADVKTIDGLKRHILTNECIDKDMDGVDLYLSDGLLRGNSSIGDVLINRDRIELRAKRRINSLPDTTGGHQMKSEPALECITVDDSDDETIGDTSGVHSIVKTESISGNHVEDSEETETIVGFDQMDEFVEVVKLGNNETFGYKEFRIMMKDMANNARNGRYYWCFRHSDMDRFNLAKDFKDHVESREFRLYCRHINTDGNICNKMYKFSSGMRKHYVKKHL